MTYIVWSIEAAFIFFVERGIPDVSDSIVLCDDNYCRCSEPWVARSHIFLRQMEQLRRIAENWRSPPGAQGGISLGTPLTTVRPTCSAPTCGATNSITQLATERHLLLWRPSHEIRQLRNWRNECCGLHLRVVYPILNSPYLFRADLAFSNTTVTELGLSEHAKPWYNVRDNDRLRYSFWARKCGPGRNGRYCLGPGLANISAKRRDYIAYAQRLAEWIVDYAKTTVSARVCLELVVI